MIYRRCGRCGKRIPAGSTCPCIKTRYAEYDKYSRDQKSKAFYNSAEWLKARDLILKDDGIDIWAYMTKGKVIPADTIHHIIPLRDDWTKRLDRTNLMPLSAGSHSEIERKYKENKSQMICELTQMLAEYRGMEQ